MISFKARPAGRCRCGSILAGLAALALAACATTRLRSHPAFLFEGRDEDLAQLVQAARTCGLENVELRPRTGQAAAAVLIDIPSRADPRFDCVLSWIGEHPETGFLRGG